MATDLWVEKYRPKTLDEYVFQNPDQQEMFRSWIKEGTIPHLLFTGPPGTGKTTAAKMLINELKLNPYDVLEINASNEAKVEFMREKIVTFASTRPFGKFKVVLLDEADHLSPTSQAVLRGVTEQFHEITRFILTGNYPHKIIPALHSRCYGIHIEKLDATEFTHRAATVLFQENVEFDLDILDTYVKGSYPDLRKCLTSLQLNSANGKLKSTVEFGASSADYLTTAVDLIKKRNIREARQVICNNLRPDEINEVYRWMYDNLSLWSPTAEGQDRAILVIKKALVNATLVADQEINLSACLVELGLVDS